MDLSGLSVTCVVPYDAGGGTDAVMRGLADAAKGSFKNIRRPAERQGVPPVWNDFGGILL